MRGDGDDDVVEQVHLVELIGDVPLDALAEREHADQGPDPDHHAGGRQERAQLLLPQVGTRLLDVIRNPHRPYLNASRVTTAPSCK